MQIFLQHLVDKDDNLHAVQISFDDWVKIDQFFWKARQQASEELTARVQAAFSELLQVESGELPAITLKDFLAQWLADNQRFIPLLLSAPFPITLGSAFQREAKRLFKKRPALYKNFIEASVSLQGLSGSITMLDKRHFRFRYGLRNAKQVRSGGQVVVTGIMRLTHDIPAIEGKTNFQPDRIFLADIYATAEQNFIEPIYEHPQLKARLQSSR